MSAHLCGMSASDLGHRRSTSMRRLHRRRTAPGQMTRPGSARRPTPNRQGQRCRSPEHPSPALPSTTPPPARTAGHRAAPVCSHRHEAWHQRGTRVRWTSREDSATPGGSRNEALERLLARAGWNPENLGDRLSELASALKLRGRGHRRWVYAARTAVVCAFDSRRCTLIGESFA